VSLAADAAEVLDALAQFGVQKLAGYIYAAAAVVSPTILCMLWFDFALFQALSVTKILLLSVSIGIAVSSAAAGASVVVIKKERPSDALAVVAIVSIGMFIQFLAMAVTGLCMALMFVFQRQWPWHSTASVSLFALLIAALSSASSMMKSPSRS
jgi:hypothetical protein